MKLGILFCHTVALSIFRTNIDNNVTDGKLVNIHTLRNVKRMSLPNN